MAKVTRINGLSYYAVNADEVMAWANDVINDGEETTPAELQGVCVEINLYELKILISEIQHLRKSNN